MWKSCESQKLFNCEIYEQIILETVLWYHISAQTPSKNKIVQISTNHLSFTHHPKFYHIPFPQQKQNKTFPKTWLEPSVCANPTPNCKRVQSGQKTFRLSDSFPGRTEKTSQPGKTFTPRWVQQSPPEKKTDPCRKQLAILVLLLPGAGLPAEKLLPSKSSDLASRTLFLRRLQEEEEKRDIPKLRLLPETEAICNLWPSGSTRPAPPGTTFGSIVARNFLLPSLETASSKRSKLGKVSFGTRRKTGPFLGVFLVKKKRKKSRWTKAKGWTNFKSWIFMRAFNIKYALENKLWLGKRALDFLICWQFGSKKSLNIEKLPVGE